MSACTKRDVEKVQYWEDMMVEGRKKRNVCLFGSLNSTQILGPDLIQIFTAAMISISPEFRTVMTHEPIPGL